MVNFFHTLLKDCAEITAPLAELASIEWAVEEGKPESDLWEDAHELAFLQIKDVLSKSGSKQFRAYVNRFGSGMVIYWHGVAEELREVDPNVLLVDAFLERKDIVMLARYIGTSSKHLTFQSEYISQVSLLWLL
ncbi:unnamed protein product [Bathycoccus prasinos]